MLLKGTQGLDSVASDVRAESGRWTGSTQTSAQRRSSILAAALLGLWADYLPFITHRHRGWEGSSWDDGQVPTLVIPTRAQH